jgi:hypothetical protein
MLPVEVHFRLVGSYSSAAVETFTSFMLAMPPATRTLPSGSSVAVP